jgi:Fe2+ transport system protein B
LNIANEKEEVKNLKTEILYNKSQIENYEMIYEDYLRISKISQNKMDYLTMKRKEIQTFLGTILLHKVYKTNILKVKLFLGKFIS